MRERSFFGLGGHGCATLLLQILGLGVIGAVVCIAAGLLNEAVAWLLR